MFDSPQRTTDLINDMPVEEIRISVVTPTFRRPNEVTDLLRNLSEQALKPFEVILVDGAPTDDIETQAAVEKVLPDQPFTVLYVRHERGTAVQRNFGIELARGNYVALIDDDVRLESGFFAEVASCFRTDRQKMIGGIAGYRSNQHFRRNSRGRWRWYKRLGLLKTFEPGRYDFETGYPVNNNMQPPFEGLRPVDFMTTACSVWRREVFDSGLRFDDFFRDFGVLEDAHFSLRARRNWKLMQCGDARCRELSSPNGRTDRGTIGYKCVVNYYYVFREIAGPLSFRKKLRFWRFQLFELGRVSLSAVRRFRREDVEEVVGRLEGFAAVFRGVAR